MDEFFELSSSFSNAFQSNVGFFRNGLEGHLFTQLLNMSEEAPLILCTSHTNMAMVSDYFVMSLVDIAPGLDLACFLHPLSSLSICFAKFQVLY